MNDFDDLTPIGRLRHVSLTQNQDAIANSLNQLIPISEQEHELGDLTVSIKTLEFDQVGFSVKVQMSVHWDHTYDLLQTGSEVKAKSA